MLNVSTVEISNRFSYSMIDNDLPSLPAGASKLLTSLNDAELDFKVLAREIANFPSISAKLLLISNSAWVAPIEPVKTIEQACAKLGLSLIRSVSLTLTMASPFSAYHCKGFDSKKYWLSALMLAEAVQMCLRHSNQASVEKENVLSTAAVLHNLGVLWLADRLPKATSEALLEKKKNPEQSLSFLFNEYCGIDYAELGGLLAQAWNLPDILQVVIRYHNTEDYCGKYSPQVNILFFAKKLVEAVIEEKEFKGMDEHLNKLGISPDSVFMIKSNLGKKLGKTSAFVNSFLSDY